MKCYFLFLFFFPLLVFGQTEKSITYQVGEIIVDENVDGKDFKPCNFPYVYQYYNFGDGFNFEGEKNEIIEKLNQLNPQESSKKSGYITIRFMVNCEGKTGMFRLQEMNNDYTETKFDTDFTKSLLTFTKNLKGWKMKKDGEKYKDYYQYLTFKIIDGKIAEILP